jgi:protein TonB
MVYPSTARMAHIAGKTKVSLHFRDGVISHAQLVQGSGSAVLDQAALAAVANAVSPVVPESLKGRDLDYQIWVSFELKHAL